MPTLSATVAPLAGASDRGAVADAARPEAACGEPDDVGVDRDLDDGVAGTGQRGSSPAWTPCSTAGRLRPEIDHWAEGGRASGPAGRAVSWGRAAAEPYTWAFVPEAGFGSG